MSKACTRERKRASTTQNVARHQSPHHHTMHLIQHTRPGRALPAAVAAAKSSTLLQSTRSSVMLRTPPLARSLSHILSLYLSRARALPLSNNITTTPRLMAKRYHLTPISRPPTLSDITFTPPPSSLPSLHLYQQQVCWSLPSDFF